MKSDVCWLRNQETSLNTKILPKEHLGRKVYKQQTLKSGKITSGGLCGHLTTKDLYLKVTILLFPKNSRS
jgi:hypothetical protein